MDPSATMPDSIEISVSPASLDLFPITAIKVHAA